MRMPDTARAMRHALHAPAATLALLLSATPASATSTPPSRQNARIEILYPCDESTVFGDDGATEVEIAVLPALALRHGDRIELRLDGRAIRKRHDGDFVLPELGGGPHYLRARLVDASGNTLDHAEPVRFYYWPDSTPATAP